MIKEIIAALKEIVYPIYCLLCRERIKVKDLESLVCAKCIEKIIPNTPPFCYKCGRRLSEVYAVKNICNGCIETQFHFDRAWASCSYEGVVKEMVHNFKYKNKTGLRKPLSRLLIDFIKDYHLPINCCDYIISIPLSKAKLREREFNQSEIFTSDIAAYFGLEVLTNNLRRIRNTRTQTEFNDKIARWRNIQGAFGLEEPQAIKEKNVLLIDDVLTTGATASEAARALKGAGANSVLVLTIAN